MTTIEIIIKLLEEKNINQRTFANAIGITEQLVTEWKAGRRHSYNRYLPEISKFLNVSVEYLLGLTDEKNKTIPEDSLDKMIINIINELDDSKKQQALEILKIFAGQQDPQ